MSPLPLAGFADTVVEARDTLEECAGYLDAGCPPGPGADALRRRVLAALQALAAWVSPHT